MADDRILGIALRVPEILGDHHIQYHSHDPSADRYHFEHRHTRKKTSLTKEHLERLADPTDDSIKKHIIDLFA